MRVAEIRLQNVAEIITELKGKSQSSQAGEESKTYRVDTAPLVHHVWTHSKENPLQVSSLALAEDLTPAWFLSRLFESDVLKNFLELALNFVVIFWLVEKSGNDLHGFFMPTMLREPSRCFTNEWAADQDKGREQALAGDWEPPLHRAVGIKSCETKPRCEGHTDDNQGRLDDQEGTSVTSRKGLGLQDRDCDGAEANTYTSNYSSDEHLPVLNRACLDGSADDNDNVRIDNGLSAAKCLSIR